MRVIMGDYWFIMSSHDDPKNYKMTSHDQITQKITKMTSY